MLNSFSKYTKKQLPFLFESKFIIAISGGLDSVVLTHLCKALNLNIALAHCNFNLRGNESNADEDFVIQLAEDLNIEAFIQNFETETYAETYKISIQMAARELRYNWFQDLAEQLDFDYILTAHHADDNLETFLINLSRGTGLEGLTGIPEINENVVRPLLQFSRENLEAYAKANNLKWREDSSNASTKYLRNKLRHDVIPVLKDINPHLLQNFENTQKYLQDTKQIVDDRINKVEKKVALVEDDVVKFNIKKLQKLSNTKSYLYELLKDYNFKEWNDVYNLLSAQSGKQALSNTHKLLKDRKYLIVSKIISEENEKEILIFDLDKKVETALGILSIETTTQLNNLNETTLYVDKDLLKFPLTVRQWQKGDYFYPFGMQGKKKLSKFFKDEKLSLLEKEKTLLLCSGDDIVWIINKRADNRFKVKDETKNILKITVNKN